jgi:hypothetical protein
MEHAHVDTRRMPAMKPVGKPDAGNPHVRFDERGGETGRESDTAPFLDSTADNPETRRTRTMTDKNSIAYNRSPPDDVPGRNPRSVNPAGTAPGHDGGGNDLKRLLLGIA